MKHASPAAFVILVSIIAWLEVAQPVRHAEPPTQQPKVPENRIWIGGQTWLDASNAAQEWWNALNRPYETRRSEAAATAPNHHAPGVGLDTSVGLGQK